MTTTLVLGGTRSGKSAVAEGLATEAATAAGTAVVTYLATGVPTDADMEQRIAVHRERRPEGWVTVEAGSQTDLAAVLCALPGVVLLDSLGTWVAGTWDEVGADFTADPTPLVAALAERPAPTVVVGEEVGLSLHAPSAAGRRFVDALGQVNQAVAAVADRVLLVVAGRTLEL